MGVKMGVKFFNGLRRYDGGKSEEKVSNFQKLSKTFSD